MNTVFQHVREDASVPHNLAETYPSQLINLIINDWNLIRCSLLHDTDLLCNEATFRFAKNAPTSQRNYAPITLGEHTQLVQFFMNIIRNVYRHAPVLVNFSGVFATVADTSVRLVYASRQNYQCLHTAFAIHDGPSLEQFQTLLTNYNFADYMKESILMLADLYDGGIFPLSLTLHITKLQNRVWGNNSRMSKPTHNHRGLSNICCSSNHDLKNTPPNMCVFKAISVNFFINKQKRIQKYPKPKQRCNLKNAVQIKKKFALWLKAHHPKQRKLLSSKGLDDYAMPLLETFLNTNINIIACKHIPRKKIQFGTKIKRLNATAKALDYFRKSKNRFETNLNMVSCDYDNVGGSYHLRHLNSSTMFCRKHFCPNCIAGFTFARDLKRHKCAANGALQKTRTNKNVRINASVSCAKLCQEMFPRVQFEPDKQTFSVVHFKKNNSQNYEVRVSLKSSDASETHVAVQYFVTIAQCADFLFHFLHSECQKILERRLIDTWKFLTNLETALNECLNSNNRMQATGANHIRYTKLLQIKKLVLFYLGNVQSYIVSNDVDCASVDILMVEILKQILYLKQSSEEINFTTKKGRLNNLSAKRYSVNFVASYLLASSFLIGTTDRNALTAHTSVLSIIGAISKDFNINFPMECNSVTLLGNIFYYSGLSDTDLLTLYSPNRDLFVDLRQVVKYGFISAEPTVVGPKSHVKSAVAVDFSKFYLNILKNLHPFFGISLLYKRKPGEMTFTPCHKNFRTTYANLVFTCLQYILPANVYFQLLGQEVRVSNYPVDAIAFLPSGEKIIIQYHGCFWHPCLVNGQFKTCHLPTCKIDATHAGKCLVCKTAATYKNDPLKPAMFKIKPQDNVNTKHRVKKKITYKQMYEAAENITKQLKQSGEFADVIIIRDCDILQFYEQPCSEFCSNFGLPIKNQFKNTTFKVAFHAAISEQFPMFGAPKLTMQTILNGVKSGHLNGFIQISMSIGPKGQQNLGGFKPFSHFENGKVKNSFLVEDSLVTTDMLKFLLNSKELPDVVVNKIYRIHEFKKPLKQPFKLSATKLLNLIEANKSNKMYSKILKDMSNMFVGNFAVKPTKWPNSIILENNDFQAMHQLKMFVSAFSIDSKFALAYFQNYARTINLEHINFQVVTLGRVEFLRMLLQIGKYLQTTAVLSCNTDGLYFGFKSAPPAETFNLQNATVFDHFLKPSLTIQEVTDYVKIKLDYFLKPGVCPNHVNAHVNSIISKNFIEVPKCCSDYESLGNDNHKLKVEMVSDHGIVIGANQNAFLNRVTQQALVKCSGPMNSVLENVSIFTEEELTKSLM